MHRFAVSSEWPGCGSSPGANSLMCELTRVSSAADHSKELPYFAPLDTPHFGEETGPAVSGVSVASDSSRRSLLPSAASSVPVDSSTWIVLREPLGFLIACVVRHCYTRNVVVARHLISSADRSSPKA